MDTPQPPAAGAYALRDQIPPNGYENTPIPNTEGRLELGHPNMDRLQTYFLLRSQLKHLTDLAKEMDRNPEHKEIRTLAGVMARAAARFLSTAQLFEMLNQQ